jgi:hypothetical protein
VPLAAHVRPPEGFDFVIETEPGLHRFLWHHRDDEDPRLSP